MRSFKIILSACELNPIFRDLMSALDALHNARTESVITSPFFKGKVIGQLAQKKEAAGKIRVFAMVDSLTQSVLSPLHQFLFSFLKSLPNDGTHDQNASVQRCFSKSKASGCSFGYDLSAATDRLPIALQMSVLEPIFGQEFVIA